VSYLYLAIVLVQILTAVHAFKTGRDWYWVWIILLFPLIGAAIYFLVEVAPDLRAGQVSSSGGGLLNKLWPGRELKLLQEQVEISDTVQNRRALAHYYMRAKEPEKAVEVYRSCLQGVFKDDAAIILDLAAALFDAGRYEQAKEHLETLRSKHANIKPLERELLYAKTLENLGRAPDAIAVYEGLIQKHSTEEGRCRLALLLEKAGNVDRARGIYEDIVKRSRMFFRHQRRLERKWIALARNGRRRLRRT